MHALPGACICVGFLQVAAAKPEGRKLLQAKEVELVVASTAASHNYPSKAGRSRVIDRGEEREICESN